MKLTDIEKKEYDRYFSYYDFSKEFRDKTFLITGSKGVVGQAVIKWLLNYNKLYNANIKIIASTRNHNKIPMYIENNDKIEFCQFGKEKEYCKDKKINYIIHCATPTDRDAYTNTPYETLQVIINGTNDMISICKEQKLVENNCIMVYVSSEEVYGTVCSKEKVDENFIGSIDSLNTRSCYPLGKKTSELMCNIAIKEYDVDIRIIRPTVIMGLFQKYEWDRVENEILRCIVENKNLVMKTKGLTKKSVVYSLDVASAIFIILLKGKSSGVYNVTNESSFDTVSNTAEKMFKRFNNKCKVVYANEQGDSTNSYLGQRELLLDTKNICELNWKAYTSFEDIYRIDIERFKKNE